MTSRRLQYSIIICTYNPDDRLLARCLKAIDSFEKTDISYEIIIVDNNSTISLSSRDYIREFLTNWTNAKVLIEKGEGLVRARLAGIKAAFGEYIIFFDDDNEPYSNYLIEMNALNGKYPNVGVWGPGYVKVEFIDGVPTSLDPFLRPIFQEKELLNTEYAMVRNWQPCYPYGTGVCIRRELLNKYVEGIKSGRLTLTGRKGGLATSGDDIQMVLTVIDQEFAAGTSPSLKLNHLIPSRKLDPDYLKQLSFSAGICFDTCLVEVLSEYKDRISLPAPKKIRLKVLKGYFKSKFRDNLKKDILFIEYLSYLTSPFYALDKQKPGVLEWVCRKMKLKG